MTKRSEAADQSESIKSNDFRSLPAVSTLLEHFRSEAIAPVFQASILRDVLEQARQDVANGRELHRNEIFQRCRAAIDSFSGSRLEPVINGTGVILHTNLGRSPVSQAAATAMAAAAGSNVSLELDPETNQRGGRMDEVSRLMRALTGAESTLVVNNNAGAVLLTLNALSSGREVIVSRGEAVEIGGGFRIPDVIAQSGCQLIEVGTTNRTYAADYMGALNASTGALLKVHTSNFRIEGFSASASTAELAALANEHGVPAIEDLGSGALIDTGKFGLRHEPTVAEVLDAGASIVTLSGDKLLGGPQAGLICGRADLVQRIERFPLARALRVDKVTLAGIVATLRHYLAGNAELEIPIWRMISATIKDVDCRARAISTLLKLDTEDTDTSIGGGSMPGETLPSVALAIRSANADALARELRTGAPRVFPFIRNGSVLIDMRTVMPEQDDALASAVRAAVA